MTYEAAFEDVHAAQEFLRHARGTSLEVRAAQHLADCQAAIQRLRSEYDQAEQRKAVANAIAQELGAMK